jgi:hypothetical protein
VRRPCWITAGVTPSASAARAGRVLRIVRAAQRANLPKASDRARGSAGHPHDLLGLDIDPIRKRAAHRDPHHILAVAIKPVGDGRTQVVVDADDRGATLLHAGHQPFLHRRIVRKRAMTIEMILAHIDEDTHRRIERRREIDLIGRDLDDVHLPGLRWRERQNGGPDIAAELHRLAAAGQQMSRERGGGRLAIGAGDGYERRLGRMAPPLAAEQLDVADHRHGGRTCEPDRPVRRRMGERHAGREHERRNGRPVGLAQIGSCAAGGLRLRHPFGVVITRDHVGTAGRQRLAACEARATETKDRNGLADEGGDRNHDHRSFRVESPISASTTEMIQKRITICGSVQPSCSK